LEVSAHSDQPRRLIRIDIDMGIKGSNNEPQGTNKMALLDAHSHDKDNGDITGTIEVTAFVYARSPRLGPHSAQKSIGRAIALQGYAAGQPPLEEPSTSFIQGGHCPVVQLVS
jgi:hypothetical protein